MTIMSCIPWRERNQIW